MQKKSVSILMAIMLLPLFASAVAAAEAEDLIKYRKSVMGAIGGHMGSIAAIMGGKVDVNHLRGHTVGLNATSKMVRDVFPPDSANGDTAAKMEIWQQPADFKLAVEQLEDAANNLLIAVDSGNKAQIGEAMKEVGGACKNCHDSYRVKKQ